MTRDDERRVRKLRLRAGNKQLIRRGAILVEDALHCASLPTSGPGLLCVRRLSLGRFRCNRSSMRLASIIEEQLKHFAVHAESPDRPEADDALAVQFRDAIHPYLLLLERLSNGDSADSWYFASAVSCWDPREPKSVSIRKLLVNILQMESGSVTLANWLSREGGSVRFQTVLETLQETDGPYLLSEIGLANFDRQTRKLIDVADNTKRIWNRDVRPWIKRWGHDDSRSVWLIAMFLISENPTREFSADWPRFVCEVAESMFETESQFVENVEQPISSVSEPMQTEELTNRRSTGTNHSMQPDDDLPTISRSSSETNPGESVPKLEPIIPVRKSIARQRDSESVDCTSRFAGLFLLIPVLERLGIAEWIYRHSECIELNFPYWILHDIATRISLETNPFELQALAFEATPPNETALHEYVVPQEWHSGISEPGICSIHALPNGFVMLDASRRLPLACWESSGGDGFLPENIRSKLGEGNWQISATHETPDWIRTESFFRYALRSWRYAIRRWCRQIPNIGLYDVVCRSGRVSFTDTHVDIYFRHNETDARVRRAGMDINPSWTPWLGKIVTFHYVDEL